MDSSFTLKEKSIIFSEDIRVSINSLRDAFEFVKKQASNEQYSENYLNIIEVLNEKLGKNEIIASSKITDKKYSFIPTNDSNDVYFRQARFFHEKISNFKEKTYTNKTFSELNRELDEVIKGLEKI